jgi:hypothetical protein
MQGDPSEERIYPSDRVVADIMDAAQATEYEVVACLRYLHEERGLKPGTRNGPHHFSWFRTVVGDYFKQKREREFPAATPGPLAAEQAGLSGAAFDAMTGAIEI